MRRAAPLLALAALVLAGCESSQEKSAKLEKVAKLAERRTAQSGLHITSPSKTVHAAETALVQGSEGAAVAVTLRNSSSTAARDVPIEVTVSGAGGAVLYTNTASGTQRTLTTVPLVPAHGELVWVDDQVTAKGGTKAAAIVGEGTAYRGAAPTITAGTPRLVEDPTNGLGAEGQVSNRSSTAQQELVVYAVARSGGRIVAAGRAVVPQLAAGASASYQVFFIGSPKGAALQVSAPPSTAP